MEVQVVEDVFEQFGEIHSVRMAKGKNFCHVRYTGEGSVDQALAMSGGGLQCVSASVRQCTSAPVRQCNRASVHQCVSAASLARVADAGGRPDGRSKHGPAARGLCPGERAGAVDHSPALPSPQARDDQYEWECR